MEEFRIISCQPSLIKFEYKNLKFFCEHRLQYNDLFYCINEFKYTDLLSLNVNNIIPISENLAILQIIDNTGFFNNEVINSYLITHSDNKLYKHYFELKIKHDTIKIHFDGLACSLCFMGFDNLGLKIPIFSDSGYKIFQQIKLLSHSQLQKLKSELIKIDINAGYVYFNQDRKCKYKIFYGNDFVEID